MIWPDPVCPELQVTLFGAVYKLSQIIHCHPKLRNSLLWFAHPAHKVLHFTEEAPVQLEAISKFLFARSIGEALSVCLIEVK